MAIHSYLQTLDSTEAIAFIASLQKIKDHLSHELEWMSDQIQQKASQLKGIEALLSEAVQLGLIPDASSTLAATESDSTAQAPPNTEPDSKSLSPALTNGALAATINAAAPESSVAATSSELSEPAQPAHETKPKSSGRSSNSNRNSTPSRTAKKSAKGRSKAVDRDLRQYLQSEFRSKPMADSVALILDESKQPLSITDVMTELYDDLSDEEYKRAKTALTNLLSVGRSKGRWNSTGRGLYVSKLVKTI